MKTFIIQLEPHDDLDSARDKLKGAKTRRAILVWPKSGKALADFYSLSLLVREAQRQGTAIGFISAQAEVRENAKTLGIPVFDSLSQAERSVWTAAERSHIDRREPLGYQNLVTERERLFPTRKNTRLQEFGRAMLFMVSILSLVALVLLFIPSAEVKIIPHKNDQLISFDIRVDPNASDINLAGVIPGQDVTLELSGTRTGTSSGQTRVGSTAAAGVIDLTNVSGSLIDIPSGTSFVVSSNDLLTFSTLEDAHLPADPLQTVPVRVAANQAGEAGNLPAGEAFTPLTTWAGSVSAANNTAFTGGTSVDSPAPTADDYEKARQALMQDLTLQAGNTLMVGRPKGTVLIPQSLAGKVVSEVRSAEPGDPADHFTIEIKMTFSATTYLQSHADELAQSILDANLQSGMKAVPDTLQIAAPAEYREQGESYAWKAAASRKIEQSISTEDLSQAMVRLPVNQAQVILDTQLKLDQGAEILVSPRWWKYMPFVAFRIQFEEQ